MKEDDSGIEKKIVVSDAGSAGDRAAFDECLKWAIERSNELRDELESGVYVDASPTVMKKMLKDWEYMQAQVNAAAHACAVTVDEINMYLHGTKVEEVD